MNPSLLIIPDRYKAAKLYSQIPDSGAGDLTFARNSNATRVNSQGLIEKVRENLALQSEAFNTTWLTYAGTSVTVNAVTAPNGTLTADRIDGTSAAFRGIYQTITSSAIPHTFSVYLKSATGSSTTCRIWVDSVAFLVTATNDWQRFSVTATTAASFDIQITAAVASAIDIYAWGAQLETGDIATDYIPTTTAAVSVGITADIPRLDYTGGGCPSLLLEPQRTNLITFSEQFDNAAWLKRANIGITANAIVSPDGTTNADRMAVTNASVVDYGCFQIVASGLNTYSVFAKKAELDYLFIGFNNDLASEGVFFNLNTGAISSNPSSYSATITDYGNGWYRCSVYFATNVSYFFISPSVNGTSFNFSGQSGNGIYIYGAQAEVGSYVSSYIPTLGSSVTRLADAASKTGISSLIGATEGTLYLDIDLGNAPISNSYIMLRNAGVTDYISLRFLGGTLRFEVVDDSVLQVAIDRATITTGRVKIALAYSLNDFVMYANGTQIGTDTSGTVPTCDILDLNFNAPTENAFAINTAATYTTRLSNAELASLTSL